MMFIRLKTIESLVFDYKNSNQIHIFAESIAAQQSMQCINLSILIYLHLWKSLCEITSDKT